MAPFTAAFEELFHREFPRIFRYLDRLSGDPDLASDLAQEAFIRLHRRGTMPDRPGVWLITVALNLFRNVRTTNARRARLLAGAWGREALASEPAHGSAQDTPESSETVRRALGGLPPRDQQMLLLRAEGYSYHDIASVLGLNEASVGTLLARAKRAFREAYQEGTGASG